MIRTYTTYALTIISGLLVYLMFAAMSAVAAGITWIPIVSFVGSILHIGISSWLFLTLPKPGKSVAIATAVIMCVWLAHACIWCAMDNDFAAALLYFIPIFINVFVIRNHLKSFHIGNHLSTRTLVLLSAMPIAFLGYMLYYYIVLFA